MQKFVLLLAGASLALAQQYSISTIAGGAPPATPASAAAISIGQPHRVATDAAGNVYFSAGNSVFKMAGGTLTLVAGNSRAGFAGDGGPAVNAQLNGPQGVAVDAAGNIYIADARNNRVRIVTPDGIINTFAGNGNVSPGNSPTAFNDEGPATNAFLHLPSGVTVDKGGNVFIADTADNMIRKVTVDGIIHRIAGTSFPEYYGDNGVNDATGDPLSAGLYGPQDVVVDSSGNIYIADTQNARIRKIDTNNVITTYAGNDTVASAGDGGAATSASLIAPMAIALDSSGNLFIVEAGDSSRVRKVDTKGNINTIAGNGTAGFAGDGGAATSAELNVPTGIAVDNSGNVYIADTLNRRIRQVSGSNISTVAGSGLLSYSGDNGPAIKAQLNQPQAVAVDAAGNVYVADSANNVVRKIDTGGTITNFAGNGKPGFGGDGGAATAAQLNSPQGVAVDAAGNVYISDSLNSRVRKVTPDGAINTVAGSSTAGYGGDNGTATSAQLYTPRGLAVDGAGNLYIADFNNSAIRKVTPGGTITTVAGTGAAGYTGNGGPAAKAQLNLPQAVALDSGGNLYIADTGNYVIRKVLTNGQIQTIAGNGIAGFSGDGGLAVSAQIGSPTALAVDPNFNVYFTDGSTRVRKVYTAGFIVTIAGNGTQGYTGDGGVATSAELNSPAGLAVDPKGNVYVADTGNNAVRLLQPLAGGISIGAVASSASGQTGLIAPGELVTLYGSGLGPAQGVPAQLNSAGLVGTSLGGTKVYFNGVPAPILYASATQVNAIVPFGIQGSAAQAVVGYQGQFSAPVTITVSAAAPGLFTLDGSGSGQALAIDKDGSINDANHPAKAGDYVILYITGAGQTNPPGVDGQPGTIPLPLPNFTVTATVGGKTANVLGASGAVGIVAGVIQVNVEIPSGLTAGQVPIQLAVGGANTQGGTTIWVTN